MVWKKHLKLRFPVSFLSSKIGPGLISSFVSKRCLRVVLNEKSSQEYPVHVEIPQGSILCPTLCLLYNNVLSDNATCDIAIYADDTTFYSKCNQASDCGNNLNCLLNMNLIYEILWIAQEVADINTGKTQLVWFDRSNNTGSTDVKMDGSVLEEKLSFKMLGLTLSSKLDWGIDIILLLLQLSPWKLEP